MKRSKSNRPLVQWGNGEYVRTIDAADIRRRSAGAAYAWLSVAATAWLAAVAAWCWW